GLAADVAEGTDVDTGGVEVDGEVRQTLVLGHRRVGAGQAHGEVREMGPRRPYLLTREPPGVAVVHGACRQRGQVRPGTRFAEELAPLLLVAYQRRQEPQPLLLGAVGEEGGAGRVEAQRVEAAEVVGSEHALCDS